MSSKIEFRTSLIMVMLPLSIGLWLAAATNDITLAGKIGLTIAGVLFFAISIWQWKSTWELIKQKDTEKEDKEAKLASAINSLVEEIRKDREAWQSERATQKK